MVVDGELLGVWLRVARFDGEAVRELLMVGVGVLDAEASSGSAGYPPLDDDELPSCGTAGASLALGDAVAVADGDAIRLRVADALGSDVGDGVTGTW